MNKYQQLSEAIRGAMEARNITEAQLATMCGVYKATVNKWLSGRHNFTLQTICKIEYVMGINLLVIRKKTDRLWKINQP